FFVTRLKRRIKYRVVKRRKVIKTKGLTSDQTILLTGTKAKDCLIQLRRVGYRDLETGQHYVFVTNIFHLSAKTIADIYRERWQVETFFKWIKQNVKIKSFLGTSKDAVMTQIWVAIITLLLLAYYKFRAKLNHSLSQILKLLQLNLFSRQNVWQLFDPGPTKHMLPNHDQLLFDFNHL
ncbi:MAG: transposase, partial [Deltaproteobacteria bacterium]